MPFENIAEVEGGATMEAPHPFTSQEMATFREVTALTVRSARPLIWHDIREPWPKRLSGGTFFMLRFDAGLIGVTANHVIETFKKARMQNTPIVSLLRTVPFDLTGAIVDRDAELDIATFSVTEHQLVGSEGIAIDCRGQGWPPPTPDPGRELSIAGVPEALQTQASHDEIKFGYYASLTRAEDTTARDIYAIYDPKRDIRIRAAPELSDLGANICGCSGGPVLMHADRNGLHRWFPVGLIVRGPRPVDGEAREYDTFQFRRIHFVNADGSISRPKVGWLP